MRVPIQSPPVGRTVAVTRLRGSSVAAADCGWVQGIKCGAEAAGIVIGPCDPVGWPEDLPLCLAALVPFVADCIDCLGPVGSILCEAVNAAKQAGIPVPASLQAACSN